jgi:hypothetical protein
MSASSIFGERGGQELGRQDYLFSLAGGKRVSFPISLRFLAKSPSFENTGKSC